MKIKLFTHTDMDGLGCKFILENVYGVDNVDTTYNTYSNIDSNIKVFLEDYIDRYDKIYITDISMGEEVAKLVNKKFIDGYNIKLIDHHKTAEWLNTYSWCDVKSCDENEIPRSATYRVYKYFEGFFNEDGKPTIETIVRHIDDYDTWKWNSNGNVIAKELNDLFYIIGFDRFTYMLNEIYNESKLHLTGRVESIFKIPKEYQLLLDLKKEEYDRYFKRINRSIKTVIIKDYTIGLVFTEQFISELGNDLANVYSDEYDFILMVDLSKNTMSLRGCNGYDLSVISKEIGEKISVSCGGHKDASGITLTGKFVNGIIDKIIKEMN